MDPVTAGLLLSAITDGEVGEALTLHRELSNTDGGPSKEAIDFYEKHQGKRCKIKNTAHVGTIVGLNKSTSGFYPGSRYPIHVKVDAGYKFEYDFSQIEIIE